MTADGRLSGSCAYTVVGTHPAPHVDSVSRRHSIRYGNVRLFGCEAHTQLAESMAARLGLKLEATNVKKFANSETK